jgi:mannose/fructose/N-acetylgalactosamine-specific phosphotransferase system component IIC
MTPPPMEFLALAAGGALLALDHAGWVSLLLSQPLLAGALGGWATGHLEAGLAAGAAAQMLWIGIAPVGGVAVAESWLGGLAAGIAAPADLTFSGVAWLDDPRLAPALVVGVAAAALGRAALAAQRTWLGRRSSATVAALARGEGAPLERLHRLALALHAGRGAAAGLLCGAAAEQLAALLARAGVAAPAGRLALVLAAASLAANAPRRGRWRWVGPGLVAGLAIALA